VFILSIIHLIIIPKDRSKPSNFLSLQIIRIFKNAD
jgi:hypothetical protein